MNQHPNHLLFPKLFSLSLLSLIHITAFATTFTDIQPVILVFLFSHRYDAQAYVSGNVFVLLLILHHLLLLSKRIGIGVCTFFLLLSVCFFFLDFVCNAKSTFTNNLFCIKHRPLTAMDYGEHFHCGSFIFGVRISTTQHKKLKVKQTTTKTISKCDNTGNQLHI